MFRTDEGRMLIVFVGLLLGLATITLALDPWARVQFFQNIGIGGWGYRHLTTLQEKVNTFNDLYSREEAISTGRGSGQQLLPSGKEWVWFYSHDPFVLIAGTERPPEGSRTNMERVDDNTLVFRSREYPITITFTRAAPEPGVSG